MSQRALIADAVISTLARDGMRGLTHRAVDRAAGLPEGRPRTTSGPARHPGMAATLAAISACRRMPLAACVGMGAQPAHEPDPDDPVEILVRGRIGDEIIDSASMRTEFVFTHAFGLPGSYE